jgi:hypothetical protein
VPWKSEIRAAASETIVQICIADTPSLREVTTSHRSHPWGVAILRHVFNLQFVRTRGWRGLSSGLMTLIGVKANSERNMLKLVTLD